MPQNDPNLHLTNLEDPGRMKREMELAESAYMAEMTPENEAIRNHAKALHEGTQATLSLLEREHGPIVIGRPQKTRWKTTETLTAQGYVGIYKRA